MSQLAAFRPYVTAGVAVVGASLIAVTPVVSNDVESILEQRAVELTSDYAVNPLLTWIDIPIQALQNLQPALAKWGQIPFTTVQQVLANWTQFATHYVTSYQEAAHGAVNYFLGTSSNDLVPLLIKAWDDIMSGQISTGVSQLWAALVFGTLFHVADPLESIPSILADISADITGGLKWLTGVFFIFFGLDFIFPVTQAPFKAVGDSLQGAYDAMNAGDLLGVVTNVLNIPGLITANEVNALTGPATRLLLNTVAPEFANAIANPNAQNIAKGGSLSLAVQEFIHQLFTGWPSLSTIITNLSDLINYLFGGGGAAAAVNVADVANLSPALSTVATDLINAADLGSLANLSVLPADIANMLGGLGGDLASMLNPAALLGMLPF